jgi:tight adherence protein B
MLLVGTLASFGALLLLALLLRPAPRQPNSERLAVMDRRDDNPTARGGTSLGARAERLADRLISRSGRRNGMATSLDVADIQLRPGEFVVLCIAGSLVLGLLLSLFADLPGFILGAVAAPLLARVFVNHRAARRRHEFDEQLPDVLHLMVSLLRSGYGLPQALDTVANQTAEPVATEFKRVLFETRIGRDPADALESTAARMRSKDFGWVVQAMRINREIGGELASILESVSETVRERQRLARQIQALTAEGRLSALLLTAIPPFLVVLLSVFSPGYFAPLTESPGPLIVAIGIVLLIIGWWWTRKLVKLHT